MKATVWPKVFSAYFLDFSGNQIAPASGVTVKLYDVETETTILTGQTPTISADPITVSWAFTQSMYNGLSSALKAKCDGPCRLRARFIYSGSSQYQSNCVEDEISVDARAEVGDAMTLTSAYDAAKSAASVGAEMTLTSAYDRAKATPTVAEISSQLERAGGTAASIASNVAVLYTTIQTYLTATPVDAATLASQLNQLAAEIEAAGVQPEDIAAIQDLLADIYDVATSLETEASAAQRYAALAGLMEQVRAHTDLLPSDPASNLHVDSAAQNTVLALTALLQALVGGDVGDVTLAGILSAMPSAAPTAQQVREEIDAHSTRLSGIVETLDGIMGVGWTNQTLVAMAAAILQRATPDDVEEQAANVVGALQGDGTITLDALATALGATASDIQTLLTRTGSSVVSINALVSTSGDIYLRRGDAYGVGPVQSFEMSAEAWPDLTGQDNQVAFVCGAFTLPVTLTGARSLRWALTSAQSALCTDPQFSLRLDLGGDNVNHFHSGQVLPG